MNIINQRRLTSTIDFNNPGQQQNWSSRIQGEWSLFEGGSHIYNRNAAADEKRSVESELFRLLEIAWSQRSQRPTSDGSRLWVSSMWRNWPWKRPKPTSNSVKPAFGLRWLYRVRCCDLKLAPLKQRATWSRPVSVHADCKQDLNVSSHAPSTRRKYRIPTCLM